jgi:hypothetical protein
MTTKKRKEIEQIATEHVALDDLEEQREAHLADLADQKGSWAKGKKTSHVTGGDPPTIPIEGIEGLRRTPTGRLPEEKFEVDCDWVDVDDEVQEIAEGCPTKDQIGKPYGKTCWRFLRTSDEQPVHIWTKKPGFRRKGADLLPEDLGVKAHGGRSATAPEQKHDEFFYDTLTAKWYSMHNSRRAPQKHHERTVAENLRKAKVSAASRDAGMSTDDMARLFRHVQATTGLPFHIFAKNDVLSLLIGQEADSAKKAAANVVNLGRKIEHTLANECKELFNISVVTDKSTQHGNVAIWVMQITGWDARSRKWVNKHVDVCEIMGAANRASDMFRLGQAALLRRGIIAPAWACTDSDATEKCTYETQWTQHRRLWLAEHARRCDRQAQRAMAKKYSDDQILYRLLGRPWNPLEDQPIPAPILTFMAEAPIWRPCDLHMYNLIIQAFLGAEKQFSGLVMHLADVFHRSHGFSTFVQEIRASNMMRVVDVEVDAIQRERDAAWNLRHRVNRLTEEKRAAEREELTHIKRVEWMGAHELRKERIVREMKVTEIGELITRLDSCDNAEILLEAGWISLGSATARESLRGVKDISRVFQVRWWSFARTLQGFRKLWPYLVAYEQLRPQDVAFLCRRSLTAEAKRKARRNGRLIEQTKEALRAVVARADREKLERRITELEAASHVEIKDVPEDDDEALQYVRDLQAPERAVTAGTSFLLDTTAVPLPTEAPLLHWTNRSDVEQVADQIVLEMHSEEEEEEEGVMIVSGHAPTVTMDPELIEVVTEVEELDEGALEQQEDYQTSLNNVREVILEAVPVEENSDLPDGKTFFFTLDFKRKIDVLYEKLFVEYLALVKETEADKIGLIGSSCTRFGAMKAIMSDAELRDVFPNGCEAALRAADDIREKHKGAYFADAVAAVLHPEEFRTPTLEEERQRMATGVAVGSDPIRAECLEARRRLQDVLNKCESEVMAKPKASAMQRAKSEIRGAPLADGARVPPSRQLAALNVWKQNHSAEIDSGTRYDPFVFAMQHAKEWPELAILIFFFLGRHCTSADVERIFSQLNRIRPVTRGSLSTKAMYWTALIRMNPDLAEQFSLTTAQLKGLAEVRKLREERVKRRNTYDSLLEKGKTSRSEVMLEPVILCDLRE